jgi:uncharacterized repeat protein (TIGR01451 family)
MLVRKLAFIAAVVGILAISGKTFSAEDDVDTAGATPAQHEPQKPKSFVDRLDAFGKKIASGFLPAKKKQTVLPSETSDPAETPLKSEPAMKDPRILSRNDMLPDSSDKEPATPRAGSMFSKPKSKPSDDYDPTRSMDELLPKTKPPAAHPKPVETPKPVARSLHERMEDFRKSPFDSDEEATPDSRVSAPPQRPSHANVPKDESGPDVGSPYPENRPIVAQRAARAASAAVARPAEPIAAAENDRPATLEAQPKAGGDAFPPERIYEKENDRAAAVTAQPKAAGRSRPVEPIYEARNDRPAVMEAQPKAADDARPLEPISEARNDHPAAVEAKPKAADDAVRAENPAATGMLFTRKAPVVSVETMGPRTIVVGRESTYQVQLMNSGDVAAEELVVHVTLPSWAEVMRIEASLGEAKPPEAAPAGAIDWKVGRLGAKSRERLTIRIIPRQSRPFDLAVRWESKPLASQAMIEVQEPKLSLQLEGPHEVLYGKKEIYRLILANKGSGNAEGVTIVMTPLGTGENLPASHKVGVLAAGEQKSLEVELTAREGGLLTIQAEAQGDGGLHAELVEKVMVRRAGLKLDIAGPKVQFVGAVAAYSIRVRNTGTAPARNVSFSIALPPGARYLSGIDGARLDTAENRLVWGLDALPADSERTFAIKCRLATVGATAVRLSAVADDDIVATAETSVQVQTVATLTMDVSDPAGPVPVGEESVYEVHVHNRGTREAQNVEVFAYFSHGIEPTSTEGAPSRLVPGQVVFQPIAALAPGEEAVLKVHAKAEVAGNHVFRAEARCRQLNARLISEATNLYYTDAPGDMQAPQNAPAANGPVPRENNAENTMPPPQPIRSTTVTPLLPRQ